jgi:AraC family transcriptional regulator
MMISQSAGAEQAKVSALGAGGSICSTNRLSSVAARRVASESPTNRQPLDGVDSSPIPYAVLVKLVQSAQQALDGDDDEAKRFIVSAADLLDAEMHRRAATEFPERLPAGNRHLAPWQTRRVIQVVEENVGGKIRLEDLARSIRLSPRQFSRAFSSDFGETPYAYVLRRRIERAQEMMLLTEEPLASIAVRCGLSDQPHLTRMFYRFVGETPASWRRRHRSAKTARANSANEQPAAMAA